MCFSKFAVLKLVHTHTKYSRLDKECVKNACQLPLKSDLAYPGVHRLGLILVFSDASTGAQTSSVVEASHRDAFPDVVLHAVRVVRYLDGLGKDRNAARQQHTQNK